MKTSEMLALAAAAVILIGGGYYIRQANSERNERTGISTSADNFFAKPPRLGVEVKQVPVTATDPTSMMILLSAGINRNSYIENVILSNEGEITFEIRDVKVNGRDDCHVVSNDASTPLPMTLREGEFGSFSIQLADYSRCMFRVLRVQVTTDKGIVTSGH
jgi:hypothetical protein